MATTALEPSYISQGNPSVEADSATVLQVGGLSLTEPVSKKFEIFVGGWRATKSPTKMDPNCLPS